MLKVGFYVDRFSFRGTEQAIFDYASGVEEFLGGQSYILSWKRSSEKHDAIKQNGVEVWESRSSDAQKRFVDRFGERVRLYDSEDELQEIVSQLDLLYVIISGMPAPHEKDVNVCHITKLLMSQDMPDTFMGCSVGYHFVYWPSDVGRGAAVGQSVSVRNREERKVQCPVLPHIVRPWPEVSRNQGYLRSRMREYLGIPSDATVIGRLGGIDTFNLDFVVDVMRRVLNARPNLFFLFATAPLIVVRSELAFHPRIIFVEPTVDDLQRCALIDACDCMLHASANGETFGLAVLEFLSRGKPVASFLPQPVASRSFGVADHYHRISTSYFADQHLVHLSRAPPGMFLAYVDEKSLEDVLSKVEPTTLSPVWFQEYQAGNVMRRFAEVFKLQY